MACRRFRSCSSSTLLHISEDPVETFSHSDTQSNDGHKAKRPACCSGALLLQCCDTASQTAIQPPSCCSNTHRTFMLHVKASQSRLPCLALPCPALPCPACPAHSCCPVLPALPSPDLCLSCPVLLCPAMSCLPCPLMLPCPACPALSCPVLPALPQLCPVPALPSSALACPAWSCLPCPALLCSKARNVLSKLSKTLLNG